ncbi:PEP/pyruvate-binding domain-containing protein [Actinokineospora enzanensis]|uniref:PEP/pyruvate-binding domain-containing protein n=1 Tax=Actinokineospora enzanensis TaxID=155975 RepID=UPI00035E2E89|nr:PEP/pyruvate-binding domain-containing protein [Actinokineospora enzanensis]
MTEYVHTLRAATEQRQVGQKAARLAALIRAGFPVPDGIVVTTEAFRASHAHAGRSSLPGPDQADRPVPAPDVADAVRAAVATLGRTPLAVRSSSVDEDLGDRSRAGEYTTVLNVADDAGLDAVRLCWASAHRAGPDGVTAPMAVLVQPMVPAVAAGVAFTADPVTGERDVVVIEAVRGLGDALVSGATSPEEWRARPAGPPSRTADKQVLTAEQAARVAVLARRVERWAGAPQDIEWALTEDEVVLLQARPITGLAAPAAVPVPLPADPPPGAWFREDSHLGPYPWSPYSRALWACRVPVLRQVCGDFGTLLAGVDIREFGGWEYLRMLPPAGRRTLTLPTWALRIAFRVLPGLRRLARNSALAVDTDLAGRLLDRWRDEWRSDLRQRIADLRDVDLSGFADRDLVSHVDATVALIAEGISRHLNLHGAIAVSLAEFAGSCERLLGWSDSEVFELMSGLSPMSTEPVRELAALGAAPDATAYAAAFEEFLRGYGCRSLSHEVAKPNLEELPRLLDTLVAKQLEMVYEPASTGDELTALREETLARARAQLSDPDDRARFEHDFERAVRAYPLREDNVLLTIHAPLGVARRAARELGRRLAERGLIDEPDDVFFLEPARACTALTEQSSRQADILRHKGERAWALAHPGPPVYGEEPPFPLAAAPPPTRLVTNAFLWANSRQFGDPTGGTGSGDTITGVAASRGTYTGPARIILDETEFGRLRPGDVLVCSVTSPVWSVLFPLVGALVTDKGGLLSHPAIIAREHGIPAVLNTGDGTRVLEDGQLITVDGAAGVVHLGPARTPAER